MPYSGIFICRPIFFTNNYSVDKSYLLHFISDLDIVRSLCLPRSQLHILDHFSAVTPVINTSNLEKKDCNTSFAVKWRNMQIPSNHNTTAFLYIIYSMIDFPNHSI